MLADMELTQGGAGMVFESVCVCTCAGDEGQGQIARYQAAMMLSDQAAMMLSDHGETLGKMSSRQEKGLH